MNAPRVGFVSLGCPKALVDSEQIITRLQAEGYAMSDAYEDSDLVVINTCGFIDSAIEESLETISDALNENGKVIVTGCLGANADKVTEKYPEVLAVTGPNAFTEVMNHIHQHLPRQHDPYESLVPDTGVKLTPSHYAYLKIAEGCNHRCSFCIIPSLRGDLDSRKIESVLEEAEKLVQSGVKELLIISQDTSAYGIDVKYRQTFYNMQPLKTDIVDLSKALGQLGIWVRLHYIYPYPHVDKLIPLMADGLILPYLDIPFQHASIPILKAMKRPAKQDNIINRIRNWREICPDLTIRSTFIVGFPGESEIHFQELLTFLEEAQLDRVGCFTYSAVDGARANALADPVPEDIKMARQAELMQLQEKISAQKLIAKIGSTMTVLVEGQDDEGYYARSKGDAPEIDGLVFIDTDKELQVGSFAEVKVNDSNTHDLFASLVE